MCDWRHRSRDPCWPKRFGILERSIYYGVKEFARRTIREVRNIAATGCGRETSGLMRFHYTDSSIEGSLLSMARCHRWLARLTERGSMPRPREFDERTVLDAAMRCFWHRGYEQTSMRDLAEEMGITSASVYNAFGDKRALYRRALDHYLEDSVHDRVARFTPLPPLSALRAFFDEIVERSIADK